MWDLNNQLVRTLVLNTIPVAIAFGNHQGDILLSVKNEIRKINYKSYLPDDYLRQMIGVKFPVQVGLFVLL